MDPTLEEGFLFGHWLQRKAQEMQIEAEGVRWQIEQAHRSLARNHRETSEIVSALRETRQETAEILQTLRNIKP